MLLLFVHRFGLVAGFDVSRSCACTASRVQRTGTQAAWQAVSTADAPQMFSAMLPEARDKDVNAMRHHAGRPDRY